MTFIHFVLQPIPHVIPPPPNWSTCAMQRGWCSTTPCIFDTFSFYHLVWVNRTLTHHWTQYFTSLLECYCACTPYCPVPDNQHHVDRCMEGIDASTPEPPSVWLGANLATVMFGRQEYVDPGDTSINYTGLVQGWLNVAMLAIVSHRLILYQCIPNVSVP